MSSHDHENGSFLKKGDKIGWLERQFPVHLDSAMGILRVIETEPLRPNINVSNPTLLLHLVGNVN
jgi:hypothetical protein